MKPLLNYIAVAFALAITSITSLIAAPLMLDFGPTTVTGVSRTNSPYHTANPSFTETTWNKVELTDVSAGGLLYSDGATATGVSLNLGSAGGGTTLDLATNPSSSSALGGSVSTGIYTSPSVGTDGIWTNPSSSFTSSGFQIGGLSAGTYDIYYAGRNTNQSTSIAYRQVLYAGTSSSSGDFNYASYSNATIDYGAGGDSTLVWVNGSSGVVLGENYVKLTISIASGEYLNLAAAGLDTAERRGFLNTVQIVAVPEPASLVLLAGGLAIVFLLHKRFRRTIG